VKRRFLAWIAVLAAILLFARASHAAVEAHILRIDPRAGLNEGAPVLTSVVELVQFTPMSEVVTNAGCGQARGDALLDCISNALEQKNALWKAFPFPEGGARLLVRVDGQENPAKFVSKTTWGAAMKDPLVGTAWLIALDASSLMGPRYADAREVANQFIGTMGPNDLAKLIIFDDRISPYVAQTGWIASKDKAQIVNVLSANPSTSPSHQRSRPLFNTHGRPEKFPMDFVIFNGQMSKHEFIEERGDQWQRYQDLGITEDFIVEKPSSVLYDFIIKGFGFTALLIGVGLLILMVYAFLAGGHHL
jgi:hypothetical protein